ncbi:hypothetical protein ACVRW4_04745 [Streptococcus phocae subsp. phocae]
MNKKAKQLFLILFSIPILVTGIDMLLSGEYLRGIIKLILVLGIFVLFSKNEK